MTTKQSNTQTQNVKVVVNNNTKGCCDDKPKPRRRKPVPKPPPEPVMPVPVQPVWAKGLSSQAVRPMVYAPSTTIIQPDNGIGNLPAYFESRFTNQQASLEQMRNSIREQFQEVQNELAQQAINNAEVQRIARTVAQAEQRTMSSLPSYAASVVPSSSSSVQGNNGGGDSSGGSGGSDPSSSYNTAGGGSTSGYSSGGGDNSLFSSMASGAGALESGQGSRVSGNRTDATSLQSGILSSFGSVQPASTSTGTVNVLGSPTISLASTNPSDRIYGSESGGQQLGSGVAGLAPQDQIYGGSSSSSSAGSRVENAAPVQVPGVLGHLLANSSQIYGSSSGSSMSVGSKNNPPNPPPPNPHLELLNHALSLYNGFHSTEDPAQKAHLEQQLLQLGRRHNIQVPPVGNMGVYGTIQHIIGELDTRYNESR